MNSMNGADEKRKGDTEESEAEGEGDEVEKESQMFSTNQGRSTRVLLGHSNESPGCRGAPRIAHVRVCTCRNVHA